MTPEDIKDVANDADFEVTDVVDIGSLDDVKEIPNLIPAAKNILLRIAEAKPEANKDNTYRSISLRLVIENGIQQPDGSFKFKNMGVWVRVCFYADPQVYNKDFFKNRQHLVALKKLIAAVKLTDASKITDKTYEELKGQLIIGDIIQRKGRTYVDKDGNAQDSQPSNDVVNFKKVPDEQLV